MSRFSLIVQHPKPKRPKNGDFFINERGEAQFMYQSANGNEGYLAMERARIEHASSAGILISGVERAGGNLRFQEWWLVFADSASK